MIQKELLFFLKKTAWFCALFAVSVALFSVFQYWYIKRVSDDYLKKETKKEILIAGDSHTQCSLNPDLIPNSANISSSAEPYFFTYNKLAYMYSIGINPKKIVLGVSFHTFQPFYGFNLFDETKRYYKLGAFMPCISWNELGKVRSNHKEYYLSLLEKKCRIPTLDNLAFLETMEVKDSIPLELSEMRGGYYNSKRSNLTDTSISLVLKRHYDPIPISDDRFLTIQYEYLSKIIALCLKNQTTVYLYNSPLYPKYIEKVPAKIEADYYAKIESLRTRYAVKFLDLHDRAMPDTCFGDGDHLNYKGATIISREVNHLLK
jgi:hypothetical protein